MTTPVAIPLTTTAFAPGQPIPPRHTGDGPDVSPPLAWGDVPAGTKSLALLCDDPDAPRGVWSHWVMWNLPTTARGLPEGVSQQAVLPDGTRQGISDFHRVGYNGPAPPPGKPHRYYFLLYALDTVLALDPTSNRLQLMQAMQGHILGQGEVMGTYGRKG
ncbi:MAG: YbhB/YbcL family Raf kinase inhibitor-like protein [Gemmataceae bacterium]